MGLMSRAMAERAVVAGRVTVNDRTVRDANTPVVLGQDRIALDGRTLETAIRRYLALNKPRGLITTARDERGRRTVYDCLGEEDAWLAPVGRLDQVSEGLLFFTNDPDWAHRLLNPASALSKVYHVQVSRYLTDAEIERLQSGIMLEDGRLARAEEVKLLRQGTRNCWLEITLHQGLNRQIRRMVQALGGEVLRLVRVAIGPVSLGNLAKGESRPLTETELRAIDQAAGARPGSGRRARWRPAEGDEDV
jgi:23S rRNA pseudouridine2605 synthase